MGSEIETFKQFPKGNDEKNGSREGNPPNEGGTERQSGLRHRQWPMEGEATRHFPSLRLPLLFSTGFAFACAHCVQTKRNQFRKIEHRLKVEREVIEESARLVNQWKRHQRAPLLCAPFPSVYHVLSPSVLRSSVR
ncbi:MAG: hypothetical protein ACTS4V_00815 [Candidatus Hodgkinia cicadicola]